jgi:hypothetical protein
VAEVRKTEVRKSERARRSFWLIAARARGGMEVLTLDAGGEVVLPIFSFQEESEHFLHPEAKVAGWSPRETTTGELASLLLGLCARVNKVALDPLPGLGEREILGLVSTGRRHFLHYLLGDVSAHPERKNSSGRVMGCSDPARLRKSQTMPTQSVARH